MSNLFPILLLSVPTAAVQFPTESPWIWPLSGDYYAPRELFQTHGQLQFLPSGKLNLHNGIDILAKMWIAPWGVSPEGPPFELITKTETETVRASFDGVVRYVHENPDDIWLSYVVVSPAADSDWGLRYAHLESMWVYEGETVFRGEILGRVAVWKDDVEHTHLDLNLVQCPGAGYCEWPPLLGNPLPYLSSRPDHVAPVFEPIGPLDSSTSAPSPTIVFLDPSQEPIVPESGLYPTLSGKVDILVHVSDRFATADLPGHRNAPFRIRVGVRQLVLALVGIPLPTPPQILTPLAYSNTIEFSEPVAETVETTPYRTDTGQFDCTEGDFYVVVTDGIESDGAWDTTKVGSGLYSVEVTAEDGAGNLSATDALVWVNN